MRSLLTFIAVLAISLTPAPAAALGLDAVLKEMDRASASYQGMKARVKWVKYTALVEDESVDEGMIAVRRNKTGGVDLKISFENPYEYYLLVRGTKVEIYRPKIATVEEYDLSRSRAKLEEALLLGFGTAGKFLRENYEVALEGEETAADVETVKLTLVPKDEEAKKNFSKIEMWISKATWQPVQQKFHQPSGGDYRLYTYTAVVINPKLKQSEFRLKMPKKTKRVFPQR